MLNRALHIAVAVCLLTPLTVFAQISNVAVSAPNVAAADEWATRVFQDPLDMQQLTDLGYYVFSQDGPGHGLSSAQYVNGLFSATTANASPNFYVLETGNPVSAKLGKTGDNFSIDANTYRMFAMRMCLTGSGLNVSGQPPSSVTSVMQWVWWRENAYESPLNIHGSFFNYGGCHIYLVNMSNVSSPTGSTWNGTIKALRLLPTFVQGVQMQIDWIRLAATAGAQTVNVTWNGGGLGDVYLDDNNVQADGTLGAIVKDSGTSKNVSSGFSFQASALQPGSYRALVCPAGSSSGCVYSAAFIVNGIPTLSITSPSEEGSSDDFATVQLNNAWDMNALTDIDFQQNVASLSIDGAFPAVDSIGNSLGSVRVLRGTPSASIPGDAYLYTLWGAGTGRGVRKQIDSNRYRILTFEMGYPGPRDINLGSIARIVWRVQGEVAENVSQDIIVNHRAGANMLDKVIVDMETLLLEPGEGSVSGWTGNIENFRIDPHEFDGRYSATPVEFWIRRLKLAAFETIGATNQYTFTWTYTDTVNTSAATNPRVTLNFDPDTNPNNGNHTVIPGCSNIVATAGQCALGGAVAAGTYYVYATFSDGVNSNSTYSKWPIVVDPAFVARPRMVVDRPVLNFGGTNNGGLTTPAQQVHLSIAGSGTVTWTVTKSGSAAHLFSVSPTSGTGPATLTVAIPLNTSIPNNLVGELGMFSVASASADNTPQSVQVFLRMTASGANPFGGFDTPAAGSQLNGSVAVTGWVLDDIGVSSVVIQRDAHPADPAGAVVNGRVFVGTATIVEGARPDIEGLFPGSPANYQAGWGYLMLTRGLIWDGQGPFNLYAVATDVDGHTVTLGSKLVSINNSTVDAQKPFGAIDSPAQGATVSGLLPNTGWVLSPGTTVPASGVQVAVDGVFLPGTFSMSDRSDITAGFPGFNTSGAGRGLFIDTTAFADGVHTIGWLVTDALNRADGVGSRFFRTQNGASLTTASTATAGRARMAGATTAFRHLGEKPSVFTMADSGTLVRAGRGMTPNPVLTTVETGAFGVRDVRLKEMERLELHVGRAEAGIRYSAYQVAGGRLRLLPVGSSFDTERGVFYWQPGVGFIGEFDFVFVRTRNGIDEARIPVRVGVGPSSTVLRANALRVTTLFAGR